MLTDDITQYRSPTPTLVRTPPVSQPILPVAAGAMTHPRCRRRVGPVYRFVDAIPVCHRYSTLGQEEGFRAYPTSKN